MKIALIGNNGMGLYKFRKELIERLVSDGLEVYLIYPFDDYHSSLENLNVRQINWDINRHSIGIFEAYRNFKKLKDIFKTHCFDLVITYTIKPNIFVGLMRTDSVHIANITGLGTVFNINSFVTLLMAKVYKFALKGTKVIFFENSDNLSLFEKFNIGNNSKRVVLNGAGVNLEEYAYSELKLDYPTFLFMGRITKDKGIEEFIEASSIVKKNYPYFQFWIAGSIEQNYHSAISELTENKVIEYFGQVKNSIDLIRKSTVVVLPSYHEGMSNTLLEAASIGRPIITSNIAGCRESVIKYSSGYVVDSKDVQSLVNTIIKVGLMTEEELISLGENGRKLMVDKFSKKKIVNETVSEIFSVKKEVG